MKKIHWLAVTLTSLILVFSACSSTETYADKLKKQDKAINRFIKDNGIEVIDHIEVGQTFGEKEFYKDDSGVYIRIIDPGDLEDMASEEIKTKVTLRYEPVIGLIENDTVGYGNKSQWMDVYPMVLYYGDTSSYRTTTYSSYYSTQYFQYLFLSPALALPLKYVGNGGRVSVVVPFAVGSYYQNYSSYEPLYFTDVEYKFR